MTEDEADAQANDLMADLFGLDEFQRIAVADLLSSLGQINWPDVTPEQEETLIALGAIVSEKLDFP